MPAGRPTKLTPALQKAIVSKARKGFHFQTIADAVGVNQDTLNEWKRRGEREPTGPFGAFSVAYKKAITDAEGELLDLVRTTETGWQRFAWLLERRWPDKYRTRNATKERLEIAKLRSEVALLKKATSADDGELKITLAYGKQPTAIDHT